MGLTCNPTFKTPANASVAVGVLAAIPLVVTGAGGAIFLAIAATGMIYVGLLPVQPRRALAARRQGWPHEAAWFRLRKWGTIINVLALIWGGLMIVNIGLWTWPQRLRRSSATTCATPGRTRSSTRSSSSSATCSTGCRRGPSSRRLWASSCVIGLVYYLAVERGRMPDASEVEADPATGEAVIAWPASQRGLTRGDADRESSATTSWSRAMQRVPELAGRAADA